MDIPEMEPTRERTQQFMLSYLDWQNSARPEGSTLQESATLVMYELIRMRGLLKFEELHDMLHGILAQAELRVRREGNNVMVAERWRDLPDADQILKDMAWDRELPDTVPDDWAKPDDMA